MSEAASPPWWQVGKTNGCTLELNVACLPTEVSLHDKTSNWWYEDCIGSELPSVCWYDVAIGWRWYGSRHGPRCPAFLFTRVDYIETKCIFCILCAAFKKLLLAHDLLQMLFFEIVKKKLFSKKQNQPISCQWAKILKSGLHFWFLQWPGIWKWTTYRLGTPWFTFSFYHKMTLCPRPWTSKPGGPNL